MAAIAVAVFRRLQILTARAKQAWRAILPFLAAKHELIPHLVDIVAEHVYLSYAGPEALRYVSNYKFNPEYDYSIQVQMESELDENINCLLDCALAAPPLQDDVTVFALFARFRQLKEESKNAVYEYNLAVHQLNSAFQFFPGLLFASNFGFRAFPPYGMEDIDYGVPVVVPLLQPEEARS